MSDTDTEQINQGPLEEAPVPNGMYAELEALLFYYGEPMPLTRIAKLMGLEEQACRDLVASWAAALQNNAERGLIAVQNGDEVQLVTRPELKSIGQKLIQEEFREQLTPAGLETLSLIAYLGPITRPEIDYIRGVNSSFSVRNLLLRGLVERSQGSEKGHLYEYRASFNFLNHMGLSKVQELPDYEKYHVLLRDFEAQHAVSASLEEVPIQSGTNDDAGAAPAQEQNV